MGLYGLDFEGIRGIRDEVARLKAREVELAKEVDALKQEFFAAFGFGMPVVLVRSWSKTFVPLAWRDMTQGKNRRVDVPFEGDLVQRVLRELPGEKRAVIMEIEFKRIHLNYSLGGLRFQLSRLKRLEREFDMWRGLMRPTKSGSET